MHNLGMTVRWDNIATTGERNVTNDGQAKWVK